MWQKHVVSSRGLSLRNVERCWDPKKIQSCDKSMSWVHEGCCCWEMLRHACWKMLRDVERWCWWGYKAARSDNSSFFLHIQLFWDTATCCYRDSRLKPISPHYYDPRFFKLVNGNTVVFLDISTYNHHQRLSPTNLLMILCSSCNFGLKMRHFKTGSFHFFTPKKAEVWWKFKWKFRSVIVKK